MANLSTFNVGDVLLTYGADMGCHKCVVKTQVLSKDEHGIVTYSDGCRILSTWENMEYYNDYFLYSEEQEKAMQEQCDNEYNEWRKACDRELEEAHRYHIERNEKTKRLIKEYGVQCGGCMVFELSGQSTFYRWKKYKIMLIDEHLNVFGVAEDEDTMLLSIDDLAVPIRWEIEKEVDKMIA